MTLAIKYENAEDARMRLRNTVVLYKGLPVLIADVQPGETKDDILRVLFQELPFVSHKMYDPFAQPGGLANAAKVMAEEAAKRKFISSKHFDIAPFRLGYVNHPNGAFYASRKPNRVQKQGLCNENFYGMDNFGRAVPFNNFLSCKETLAMIRGDYPSIDRAAALLDKCPSVAFDRDFALVKDEAIPKLLYIYHKAAKVGMFSRDEIVLGTKFSCLKERLGEMQLKVGVC